MSGLGQKRTNRLRPKSTAVRYRQKLDIRVGWKTVLDCGDAGTVGERDLRNRGILAAVHHSVRRAGGETSISIRHFELSSPSFWVIKLLRQSARFLRSEVPVSRIGQKFGH